MTAEEILTPLGLMPGSPDNAKGWDDSAAGPVRGDAALAVGDGYVVHAHGRIHASRATMTSTTTSACAIARPSTGSITGFPGPTYAAKSTTRR